MKYQGRFTSLLFILHESSMDVSLQSFVARLLTEAGLCAGHALPREPWRHLMARGRRVPCLAAEDGPISLGTL